MKRQHRLRRQADLRRVRQQGRLFKHRLALLHCQPNGTPLSRFGFSVSRRIGKAVRRNLVRRRLREVVRLHLKEIPPGWDCLLVARAPAAFASYQEVELAVLRLLQQAHLLSDVGHRPQPRLPRSDGST